MKRALLLLTIGCGPQAATECRAQGLEFFISYQADCRRVAQNVDQARTHLDALGLKWPRVPVYVHDEEPITVEGQRMLGAYRFFVPSGGRIDLARSGRSLLHELIHASEAHFYNVKHEGWSTLGYYEADRVYKASVGSLAE